MEQGSDSVYSNAKETPITPSIVNSTGLGQIEILIPEPTKYHPFPKPSQKTNQSKTLLVTSQQFPRVVQNGLLKVAPRNTSTISKGFSRSSYNSENKQKKMLVNTCNIPSTTFPIIINKQPVVRSHGEFISSVSTSIQAVHIPAVSTAPSKDPNEFTLLSTQRYNIEVRLDNFILFFFQISNNLNRKKLIFK